MILQPNSTKLICDIGNLVKVTKMNSRPVSCRTLIAIFNLEVLAQTLLAGQADPVDDQVPPKSNTLQPYSVVFGKRDSLNSKTTNRPHKLQLTPCVVNLEDWLQIDALS